MIEEQGYIFASLVFSVHYFLLVVQVRIAHTFPLCL